MSKEVLSILMPCYRTKNVRAHFRKAKKVIMKQTFENWKCYMITGCANTYDYIKDRIEDDRFVVIKIDHSRPWFLIEWGIKHCTGEYIHIHDHDDWLMDEKSYERMVSNMTGVMHYGGVSSGGPKSNVTIRTRNRPPQDIIDRHNNNKKLKSPTHLGASMWRKDYLEKFSILHDWGYDVNLLIKTIIDGNPVSRSEDIYYYWNKTFNSFSVKHKRLFMGKVESMLKSSFKKDGYE